MYLISIQGHFFRFSLSSLMQLMLQESLLRRLNSINATDVKRAISFTFECWMLNVKCQSKISNIKLIVSNVNKVRPFVEAYLKSFSGHFLKCSAVSFICISYTGCGLCVKWQVRDTVWVWSVWVAGKAVNMTSTLSFTLYRKSTPLASNHGGQGPKGVQEVKAQRVS